MPAKLLSAAALLLLLLVPANAALGRKIPAMCTACKSVAQELNTRIDKEPPKNHLDMRHRLDSRGERYGKMIDYKMSELRAVELLEDLCKEMKYYVLVKVNETERWEHVNNVTVGADRKPYDEEEVQKKQLEGFCGRILDEHDEDLTAGLMSGNMEKEGVAEWMCTGLLKVCKPEESKSSGSGSNDSKEADKAASAENSKKDEL